MKQGTPRRSLWSIARRHSNTSRLRFTVLGSSESQFPPTVQPQAPVLTPSVSHRPLTAPAAAINPDIHQVPFFFIPHHKDSAPHPVELFFWLHFTLNTPGERAHNDTVLLTIFSQIALVPSSPIRRTVRRVFSEHRPNVRHLCSVTGHVFTVSMCKDESRPEAAIQELLTQTAPVFWESV